MIRVSAREEGRPLVDAAKVKCRICRTLEDSVSHRPDGEAR